MQGYKNYNIQIKGRVQDIGFRNLVENIAKSLNLRGMVYNDADGTVRIVCQGAVSSVKSLIEEIRSKSSNVGASISEVSQEEIPGATPFPPVFFKAPTDELSDISRKLEIGIESLQGIERNTGLLTENTNTLIALTNKMVAGQDSLVKGQESLVKGQEKMIALLEKIAEK